MNQGHSITRRSPAARIVRASAPLLCGLLFCLTCSAQNSPNRVGRSGDVAATYTAEHSLRAATDQSFWMQGGSAEIGMSFFRGFGAAANITGAHTGSIGSAGVPLSLMTFTAGPRYRLNLQRRTSAYGEALFGVAHGFDSIFPRNGQAPRASATSFALQVGGGVDVRASHRLSVRALDISYVHTSLPNGSNDTQNILRIGAGLAIRFGAGR